MKFYPEKDRILEEGLRIRFKKTLGKAIPRKIGFWWKVRPGKVGAAPCRCLNQLGELQRGAGRRNCIFFEAIDESFGGKKA